MKIGIILGAILGIVLLLISLIGFFLSKNKTESSIWYKWLALAGVCALVTAVINALKML
ncbi:hypothetical protein IMX26_14595 [Clostridium sp. 'deep sea']|uniref:hypothetical protein n=1 Tax=Clostridium sp. 'deep sea' TaxID=2779445 RepID=UPI0018966315|nr:hypothetical protein [Clostridium sp. 'deep sea']QOR34684.1 hypothetical protein IMX26_14595 [Clostridium sp. 'deep sea']